MAAQRQRAGDLGVENAIERLGRLVANQFVFDDAGTIELDVRTDSSRKSGMVFTVTEIAEPSRIDVDQAAKALGELTETLQREQQDGGGL